MIFRNSIFNEKVKARFYKNRLAVISFQMLMVITIIGFLADFISNEKPFVAQYRGEFYFPLIKSVFVKNEVSHYPKELQNVEWKNVKFDFVIFPPIPYLPGNIDYENAQSVSPFSKQKVKSIHWRHWLGTDELGRDVMAGLIHGTKIAVMVGVISMSIAALIGVLLGSLSGFFGDEKLKISRGRIMMNCVFLFFGIFYSVGVRWEILVDSLAESLANFSAQFLLSIFIFLGIMTIGSMSTSLLKRIPFFQKKISIPLDLFIMRTIEIFLSVPVLFLIVSVVAIAKPSLLLVIVIIGLTSWTGIARYMRSELLRIRQLEFIEATHALGFSSARIIFRHALPNAISPVLVALSFGIANAILIESSLSFLGVGVPAETITWGSILSAARISPSAWWLAVFPGLAIFMTVTMCNLLGEGLSDALNPKIKE